MRLNISIQALSMALAANLFVGLKSAAALEIV